MGTNKRGFTLISKACNGFTLIEVFVVVGIIALLIIISIGTYRAQLLKGKDAHKKADINTIKIALEEYEKDHDCYPVASEISCVPGGGLSPYLNKIPCQPDTSTSYYYYTEEVVCPKWYWIFTSMDSENDGYCRYGCGPSEATAIYNFYSSSPNAETPYVNEAPVVDPETGSEIEYSGLYKCLGTSCVPELVGDNCDPNFSEPSCGGGACSHLYNNCGH